MRKGHFNPSGKFEFRSYLSYYSCESHLIILSSKFSITIKKLELWHKHRQVHKTFGMIIFKTFFQNATYKQGKKRDPVVLHFYRDTKSSNNFRSETFWLFKLMIFYSIFRLFPIISISQKFLNFFPHTGKNRNRRKSNLLP